MDGVLQQMRRLGDLLRKLGRSREDAEDLIQEAFLRLQVYCQTHQVQQEEAFLVRTVQNLAVDTYRRAHRELYVDEPVETLPILDVRLTPDEDVAVQERLERVWGILDSLKPRTRDVFLMHRLNGYSSAQIGETFGISVSAVGISVSAVEKHIARAVLALMTVDGIFRAGNSERFAQAISDAYRLSLLEEPQRIVLAAPSRKARP